MAQKPTQKQSTRTAARTGLGFETGERHRAHIDEEGHRAQPEGQGSGAMTGPRPPVGAAKVESPFHSKPAAKESVPRRKPILTLGIVGGLLAIIALGIAMLFSSPDYVETQSEPTETIQVEARR